MARKLANGANGLLAECYPAKKTGSTMSFSCFVWAVAIVIVIVIVIIVLL